MKKINKILTTMFLLSISIVAKAQEAKEVVKDIESSARYEQDYSYYLMYLFLLATVVGFIYAAYVVTSNRKESTINKILYDAVPVEREKEIMTDHEYDGIKELDNHLPPWWVWLFYLTLIFAVVYSTYYWWTDYGLTQEQEYEYEMMYAKNHKEEIAKKLESEFDESNVLIVTDAEKLAEGKDIYTKDCIVCHLADGGGIVGPNLTDKYWIHGGSPTDIYKIIKEGVIEKGMLAWKDKYSPYQIQNVMSYIQTELKGTTPAKPKEAQGEEYIELN